MSIINSNSHNINTEKKMDRSLRSRQDRK